MDAFRQTGECQGKSCRQAQAVDGAVQVRYDNLHIPKSNTVATAKMGDEQCSGLGSDASQIPCEYIVAARLVFNALPFYDPLHILGQLRIPYRVINNNSVDVFARDYLQLQGVQEHVNRTMLVRRVRYLWSPRKVMRVYKQLFEPTVKVRIQFNDRKDYLTDVYRALRKVGMTVINSNDNTLETFVRASDPLYIERLTEGTASYTVTADKWIPCGFVYETITVEAT